MTIMKLTTWDEIFAPIIAQGREVRDGQRTLGNAIIEKINNGGNLMAECSTGTGKSYGTLLPVIVKIIESKDKGVSYRGVVSTETLTLQNQIFQKDLPFLANLYEGFTFTKLMGRSNYVCLNAAKDNAIGVASLDNLVQKLIARKDDLRDGEKADVERVIGRKLTKDEWEKIAGSSAFCGDNQCSPEYCSSAKARARAKTADIVVANHAILATDLDIRQNATSESQEDGILGTFETLIVDEGHQLAPVLVEQWTKELTMWELSNLNSSIVAGIEHAQNVMANDSIGRLTSESLDDVMDVFKNIQNFYSYILEREGADWKGSSSALCLKYLSGSIPEYLMFAMNEYETKNPERLAFAEQRLVKAIEYLKKAAVAGKEQKLKKWRKISKAMRSANDLLDTVRILSKAIETTDGIISQYGVYGATVKGWEKRDGTQGMTLRLKPMDISARAQYLWHTKTNVVVSATLTDLTDGTFKYAKACIGFPERAKELRVSTPFDLQTQQLVYISPAKGEKVQEVRGAQFDFKELVALINASRGRALILFTSRMELDWASSEIIKLKNKGQFSYPILVQDSDSDKAELMEKFKNNIDSVLFATKSFFVGIDVAQESLSQVILCKFPLPQYSAECKQQVIYWRNRGFSRWYERESLTTLQQAAGRLIRSSGCKGVVSIIDHRVSDSKSSVYKTARIGVTALGSPYTINIEDVHGFFG